MKNQTGVSFYILQGLYGPAYACFTGYIPAFALSRGFSESFVGNLLSVGAIVSLIGLFVGSALSDRIQSNKLLFIVTAFSIIPFNLLIFSAHGESMFFAAYILFCLLSGPTYSILDTWTLKTFLSDSKSYSRSRACGSAGQAVIFLISGQLIEYLGYAPIFVISIGLHLAIILIALLTPDKTKAEILPCEQKTFKRDLGFLLIPIFLPICIFMLLLGMGANPYQNLKIILLQHVGSGVGMQGVDMFISFIVQIFVFFFCESLIRRFRLHRILFACAVMILSASLISMTATHPWQIILGTCLIQVNYGMLFPAIRVLTTSVVPSKNLTLANSIIDSCYGYIAVTISLSYSGYIAKTKGVPYMLGICAVMSVLGAATALWVIRINKKNTHT